jgi:hypothetical protein
MSGTTMLLVARQVGFKKVELGWLLVLALIDC